MYGFVFKSKLKKLNPDLYVDDLGREDSNADNAQLRLREYKHSKKSNYHYAGEAEEKLRALESGHDDTYVTAVARDWVPEYDHFSPEGKLWRKGYRTILHFLAKKKLISLEKAYRVFGFGPSFYEHMSFEEKRAFQVRRNSK